MKPDPIFHDGGQERNILPGTLSMPGIVGFGKAVEISQKEIDSENNRFKKWSQKMLESFEKVGGKLNGHAEKRLPHNLSVFFKNIEGKTVINSISKNAALSAGPACTRL